MESSTGLGSVLGAITGLGKSYFENETAAKNAKQAARNSLATSTLTTNAQKAVWIGAILVIGLIVFGLVWKSRR